MSRAATKTLTWSLWTVFLAVVACDAVLAVLNGRTKDYLANLPIIVGFVAFATVGAFIGSRRRGNTIGWIYLGGALGARVGNLAEAYADFVRKTHPGSLPGGVWALWLGSFLWLTSMVMLVIFSLLLFPDGRPASPRWRPVVWTAATALVLQALSAAFRSGPIENFPRNPPNPIGIAALDRVFHLLEPVVGLMLLAAVLATVASLFVRFRRASGNEREQMKWLAWAGALFVAFIGVQAPLQHAVGDFLPNFLLGTGIALVPLATGLAIFRYRLYDIDRIISRTLAYAIVTIVLGGLFVLIGLVVPTMFLAGGRTPDWIIAVATLIVAALSRPVRRRAQAIVDRRFNRSRYDAEHTIETFTARLRDEVDIDALGAELEDVVSRTMQPTHVSLWLTRDAT